MKLFGTALSLLVWATAHALGRVRRDYKERGTLTAHTVAEVWVIYVAHAVLTLWASALRLLPIKVPRAVRFLAGGGLTLAGLLMMEKGIREFRSFQRMSGMRVDQLVTSGIYRYTRNPQNVGWAIASAGISILGRSGAAAIATVAFWLGFRSYVPTEESYLRKIFGEEYQRYASRTPRYLGWRK